MNVLYLMYGVYVGMLCMHVFYVSMYDTKGNAMFMFCYASLYVCYDEVCVVIYVCMYVCMLRVHVLL